MAHNKVVRYTPWCYPSSCDTGQELVADSELLSIGSEAVCGICIDPSGNMYVSDSKRHMILKKGSSGRIRVLAGAAGVRGDNGSSTVEMEEARFADPGGLACDRSGNIYVADTGNNQIRILSGNRVSLLAGSPTGVSGMTDGSPHDALFNMPYDVEVDPSGKVYVADTLNHAVRIIDGGRVVTYAGDGVAGDQNGYGSSVRFNKPYAVCADRTGKLFVSDSENRKVKAINTNGLVYTYSGSGDVGWKNGPPDEASYHTLKYSDVDPSGNVFVVDYDDDFVSRIRRVDTNGSASIVRDINLASSPYVNGLAINKNGVLYVVESTDTEFDSSSNLYVLQAVLCRV